MHPTVIHICFITILMYLVILLLFLLKFIVIVNRFNYDLLIVHCTYCKLIACIYFNYNIKKNYKLFK